MKFTLSSEFLRGDARRIVCGLTLLLLFISDSACRRDASTTQRSTAQTAVASPRAPQTTFQRDLDYVRHGQFARIYIFARKDGATLQSDDIAYLKSNSPPQTNMWLKSDEGRRVIAGTNFEFKPEHVAALGRRFTIEDYTGR